MIFRHAIRAILFALLLAGGCASSNNNTPPTGETGAEEPVAPAPTDIEAPPTDGVQRPAMTRTECESKGGTIVGDIGDGAIHRPDYLCDSGQPPMGTIQAADGEPVAIEGSVCCP